MLLQRGERITSQRCPGDGVLLDVRPRVWVIEVEIEELVGDYCCGNQVRASQSRCKK